MANEESYKELKAFICTGCGKEIMLTKFASQKTCQCDECKTNKVPINQDIVASALAKNPPKMKKKSENTGGVTKIRPCIKCGADTEVSKFMSDKKVLCDDCKGVTGGDRSTNVKGLAQRMTIDISKIDRSKLLPIEEYEVNDAVIANKRLREVKCPACGHEYMKPLMVADWSQFGLIINYQCSECLLTMTISEQCGRMLSRHNAGERFDYTGHKINELSTSSIDQSRMVNIVRGLIRQLDDNNITIEDVEAPQYRWKNDKPVQTGFEIPKEEEIISQIDKAIKSIKDGNTDNARELLENLLK